MPSSGNRTPQFEFASVDRSKDRLSTFVWCIRGSRMLFKQGYYVHAATIWLDGLMLGLRVPFLALLNRAYHLLTRGLLYRLPRRAGEKLGRFRLNWLHPIALPFCALIILVSPVLLVLWLIVRTTLSRGHRYVRRVDADGP